MKKQATPPTGAASSSVGNHIRVRGPYQVRCIRALLIAPIKRTDLDRAIGTTNAPEFVRQLRLKGLKIHMDKITFINRDGHKKWRGKYHLDPASRDAAYHMLGGD